MDLENLAYALTQVAHNFGAVVVVGGALLARWPVRLEPAIQHKLGWMVLGGWTVQGASGMTFGAISYAYYGQFPDLHGIAIAALLLKVLCAAAGFVLAAIYLRYSFRWSNTRCDHVWSGLFALAATALTAAAFLRWFA